MRYRRVVIRLMVRYIILAIYVSLFLRLGLNKVKGAISFDKMRSWDQITKN